MSLQVNSSDKRKFFDLLYQKTGVYLYFVTLQILQNEEDAKDAFCDTYRKTFEDLDKLRSTSQLIETLYQKLALVLSDRVLSQNPKLFEMYQVSNDHVNEKELIPEKIFADPRLAKDLVTYLGTQCLIQEKICLYFYYFLNFNGKQIASLLHTQETRVNYFINSAQNLVSLRLKVFNRNQPVERTPLEGVPNFSKLLLDYAEKSTKLPSSLQELCWEGITAPQQQAEDVIDYPSSEQDQDLVVHIADTKVKHRVRSLFLAAVTVAVIVSCAILPNVFADTKEQELYQDGLKKNLAQIHSESSSQEEIPVIKEQENIVYDPASDPGMVNDISLSENKVSLEVDESVTIDLTVLPETAEDKSVLWISDDDQIATVTSEGKITGISAGRCEITVTSKANPSVTASITVTVIEKEESSQEESSTETPEYSRPSTPSQPTVPPESSEQSSQPSTSSDTEVDSSDSESVVPEENATPET